MDSPDVIQTKINHTNHRFLDEAGDTAFYGPKKKVILGEIGVSKAFYLGCVKFKCPLDVARLVVEDAQRRVIENPSLARFQSVIKRSQKAGFHFHAKLDPPPIKWLFLETLADLSCSLEIIVARKSIHRFSQIHEGKENLFYADVLGHLLKGKLRIGERLVFNIAQRGGSTRSANLDRSLELATGRALKKHTQEKLTTQVAFNVQEPSREILLTVADYLSWTVQRVFETGDTSYYDMVQHKISVINDIYDTDNYENNKCWYGPKRPLTAQNKISPPTP